MIYSEEVMVYENLFELRDKHTIASALQHTLPDTIIDLQYFSYTAFCRTANHRINREFAPGKCMEEREARCFVIIT